MLAGFLGIFKALFNFLKIPLIIAAVIIAVFAILVLCNIFHLHFVQGVPFKTGAHCKVKKRNFFLRLFWDAPRRYAKDLMDRDPEFFRHQGIVIFTGKQGNGKTVGMIHYCRQMQEEYPKAYCMSNLKYKYADRQMESWDDLIDFQNPNGSKCGIIAVNDEIQNTFNSKQSKDFPMEYLGIVTQNRKNRRIILGTAQNFYMLSKDIRSQCTEIRKCNTFLGCVTVVSIKEPEIDNEGNVVKLKHRGMYFFVHDKDLRDSYDTFEVIKKMQKAGFKSRTEQVSAFSENKIVIDKKALKK